MALALSRPLFWITIAFVILVLFSVARRSPLRWLPAFFFRLALLIFVVWELFAAQQQAVNTQPIPLEVLIVDQSDSLDPAQKALLEEQAIRWKKVASNRVVLAAGKDAYYVAESFHDENGKATNLEKAIDLALEVLSQNGGRIMIASDGLPSNALAFDARLALLQQKKIPVDVIPIEPRSSQHDVYLGRLVAPQVLWANSTFRAYQELSMPEKGAVLLELKVNGETITSQSLDLDAGNYWIEFPLEAKEPGTLTLATKATYPADVWEGNNQAFASVQIHETPRVLLITQSKEEIQAFAKNLQSLGISIEIKQPSEVSEDQETFRGYRVIILHNLLATNLSNAQLAMLRREVVDYGKGLIITGGLNSLTLGGYLDTPLEPILPVKLEPPPRNARAPLAFVIMLDSSGSMGTIKEGKPAPIALASEAAARTIESLQSDDYFGLLSFTLSASWKLPIRLLGDGLSKRLAMDAVSNIRAYGGTKLLNALQECWKAIQENSLPVEHKNLLILSDGKSSDGKPPDFIELVKSMNQAGWTVSVVSFGEDVNGDLLEAIAKSGNGRYHHVKDASELPRVMIAESKAASGENIQEGPINLAAGDPSHPILGGFTVQEFPPIETYNALTSRKEEGSEDILISNNFGDPILSAWQVGLGRVMIWATDLGGEWAPDWEKWKRQGEFWSRIIRYALPDPSFGSDRASVTVDLDHVLITAHLTESGQIPPSRYPVEYVLSEENLHHPYQMLPVAPETYQTELDLADAKVYLGAVQYRRDDQLLTLPVPFAINYPSEWTPPEREKGRENLTRWATFTGGKVLPELPDGSQPVSSDSINRSSAWSKIILLLLIAWPLEIAIRRRWLPWR